MLPRRLHVRIIQLLIPPAYPSFPFSKPSDDARLYHDIFDIDDAEWDADINGFQSITPPRYIFRHAHFMPVPLSAHAPSFDTVFSSPEFSLFSLLPPTRHITHSIVITQRARRATFFSILKWQMPRSASPTAFASHSREFDAQTSEFMLIAEVLR